MQHARIAVYQVKPGTAEELAHIAQSRMLPIYNRQPGFVAYGGITTASDTLISISFWQTQEQAEAAVQAAATFVRENIAEMIVSVQNYVGDLNYFSSTDALGS